MSDEQALAGFLDKWRSRWPEWGVAEVFVPASQRDIALAWFALRQELTDAAWAGSDPRPGEAKLAWWAEELQGWPQGRRRHPLGIALQRLPAPWPGLAASLTALLASREPVSEWDQATDVIAPFAASTSGVAAALFASVQGPVAPVTACLLAEHVLLRGDAAAPLRTRAQLGGAAPELATARAWAQELLQRWPATKPGSRTERIHAGLLHERLRRFAAGGVLSPALPRPAALWASWRAARG